ncbi:ParA family protein [Corynebacterium belfantii]|uniref:ParA family protein n=1 Tax=Corynebacterium belfantii TaxID=2014537 RepID=UPI0035A9682F
MTIIAISNLKGGTGKTTSAVLLATAFYRAGNSVTVVDLDPQGSATEWPRWRKKQGNRFLSSHARQRQNDQEHQRERGLHHPGLPTRRSQTYRRCYRRR